MNVLHREMSSSQISLQGVVDRTAQSYVFLCVCEREREQVERMGKWKKKISLKGNVTNIASAALCFDQPSQFSSQYCPGKQKPGEAIKVKAGFLSSK